MVYVLPAPVWPLRLLCGLLGENSSRDAVKKFMNQVLYLPEDLILWAAGQQNVVKSEIRLLVLILHSDRFFLI